MNNTNLYNVSAGQRLIKRLNFFTLVMTTSVLMHGGATAVVIQSEGFEYSASDLASNLINFTASEANVGNPTGLFHDGSSDYFTIANVTGSALSGAANVTTPFSGFSGQYFIAEDIDDGATKPGTQTLGFTVNISGYNDITLDMLFAAGGNDGSPGYDSNDGFIVRATIDANPTQNILAFEAVGTTNENLSRDTDFDGTGDGFQPTAAAKLYENLSISGTGNSLVLEIVISSNDGNGEFAFDDIVINGNVVPEPSSSLLSALAGLVLVIRRRR